MNEPSLTTIKRLFVLSNNRCAFPRCISPIISGTGTILGKICHIHAKKRGGPRYVAKQSDEYRNSFENLILLCGTHHDTIDKEPGTYTAEILHEMKQAHEKKGRIEVEPGDDVLAKILLSEYKRVNITNNSGNIMFNSPGSIQANSVHIRTTKKNVKVMPPDGTISSDLRKIAYVKHLIKRYHEFAGGDTTRKGEFAYAALYKNIEKNFGVKWDFVPINRFEDLVEYLQKRINKTRQACINKGKGYKSYSSFEEFCEKHEL
jgi:hypothetical protein